MFKLITSAATAAALALTTGLMATAPAQAAKMERKVGQFGGPEMKLECSKWAKPWPGAKICIGHTYKFKQHAFFIEVNTPNLEKEVEQALRRAFERSMIAALAAAAATPGEVAIKSAAAFAAFKATLYASMSADTLLQSIRNKVSAKLDHRSYW